MIGKTVKKKKELQQSILCYILNRYIQKIYVCKKEQKEI